jgi:RNA polymerase sigma factor (sigma-70 family)
MSDADLVEACRRGERGAFAALIERHARMVAGVAFAAAGDGALVDDVVQDTFVAAWQRLASLRDSESVRPWLRRIAQNLARKARRRRVREVAERDVAADATPFDAAVARERAELLEIAIARLGPRYREPLVLFYYEQQSIKEVASALRLGEEAVMQRLSRARKQLGDALDADVRSELSRRAAAPVAGIALAVLALVGGSEPAAAAPLAALGSKMLRVGAAIGVLAAAGWLLVHSSSTSSHAASHVTPEPPTVVNAPPQPALPAEHPPASSAHSPASELAIEGVPHGSGAAGSDWADHIIRNVVVAVDDPIETCRRGVRGLAIAALSPPDGHGMRVPNDRIRDRADDLADRIAPSCEGDAWPELWAICEGSPSDVLDGNVTCYPYTVFD